MSGLDDGFDDFWKANRLPVEKGTLRRGWKLGAGYERARIREKVEAMHKGAIADRTRAFNMEWAKDHAKLSERCDTLAEVLALLAEPGEERT